ncbi:hypothetical protein [Halobacteriovorax sp.]|uniref:hypothetical protein n=1 Tax=Halobacteriovorax sp. TaxID=2020862 RepID=UPI003565EB63
MQLYQDYYKSFNISELTSTFQGDFENGINACIECIDRHTGKNKTGLLGREWKVNQTFDLEIA